MSTLPSGPSGPDDCARALPVLLRWRPVNTEEAAELLGLAEAETERCLATLAERGYLAWDGENLGYQSPEQRTIAQVGDRLDDVRRRLDDVEYLLQELPVLVENWALRSHLDDPHTIEVIRGPVPMAEIWTRQLATQPPQRISMFMPEVVGIADVGADPDEAEAYLAEMGVDVRVVVASAAVSDPDPARAFAGIASCAKVRIHPGCRAG
ncbi:helix-turn-helix domain-containing protein [Nocardioides humi]|uniref:helix-turn-helix domain-containing protein n=1 Tax=Nocardioides humi TaxID=449461 RepID=UPI0011297170|nr:helix-turn-helix domain-containing protein [Nocardioides humi]